MILLKVQLQHSEFIQGSSSSHKYGYICDPLYMFEKIILGIFLQSILSLTLTLKKKNKKKQ